MTGATALPRPTAQLLQLPSDRAERDVLRQHRQQPAPVRQDARQQPEVQKYVYGKIYNASIQPVFQHAALRHSGTLTEQQIKDLVALLLDPNSRSINRPAGA